LEEEIMGRCVSIRAVLVFALSILTLGFAGQARADTAVPWITDPGTGTLRNNYTSTLGANLTVNTTITVTALGFWDSSIAADTDTGLNASHQVGIWNSNGTDLLASVTVPAGTAGELIGQFRYADLTTPLVLTAGQTYLLGAAMSDVVSGSSQDLFRDNTIVPVTGVATDNYSAFSSGGSGTFNAPLDNNPLDNGGVGAFVGPNFLYIPPTSPAVPLPSGIALAGIGMLVVCVMCTVSRSRFQVA
jgi:hypothetical protein